MLTVIFAVAVVVAFAYLDRSYRKIKEQLVALEKWGDASNIFINWCLRNPGVYIGLSEEGRRLLSKNIEAFDEFCRVSSSFDGKKHREWLISLFFDLPPKHPKRMLTKKKKGYPEGCPFSLKFKCQGTSLTIHLWIRNLIFALI